MGEVALIVQEQTHTPRTRAGLHAVALRCDQALAPHHSRPPEVENADLTDRLISALHALAPVAEASPERQRDAKTDGALRDMRILLQRGPTDGPFANWLHMRALARVTRTLIAEALE